ncbi:MAG: radical SAM protein, partial [Chloroflexi bacterium]|nr:radical SAM protein [Chloroflexota bacterium]
MNVVLLSTYDLGHQPFGLASPAAWLAEMGVAVTCVDVAVQPLAEAIPALQSAQLIALYVPMHTATRLAATLLPRLRRLNPTAHFCAYGLYAPMNEPYLRQLGVQTILGGEFEQGLVDLAAALAEARPMALPPVSLA